MPHKAFHVDDDDDGTPLYGIPGGSFVAESLPGALVLEAGVLAFGLANMGAGLLGALLASAGIAYTANSLAGDPEAPRNGIPGALLVTGVGTYGAYKTGVFSALFDIGRD